VRTDSTGSHPRKAKKVGIPFFFSATQLFRNRHYSATRAESVIDAISLAPRDEADRAQRRRDLKARDTAPDGLAVRLAEMAFAVEHRPQIAAQLR
jgi:hypothetical protein